VYEFSQHLAIVTKAAGAHLPTLNIATNEGFGAGHPRITIHGTGDRNLSRGTAGGDGELLDTFTILTTDANATVAPTHDPMPVVVEPTTYATGLDATKSADGCLLRPYPMAGPSFVGRGLGELTRRTCPGRTWANHTPRSHFTIRLRLVNR
jgi:hypothetical protein